MLFVLQISENIIVISKLSFRSRFQNGRSLLSKLLPFFKRLNIDWFLPCSRNDHGLRGTLDLCGDNIATKMKR